MSHRINMFKKMMVILLISIGYQAQIQRVRAQLQDKVQAEEKPQGENLLTGTWELAPCTSCKSKIRRDHYIVITRDTFRIGMNTLFYKISDDLIYFCQNYPSLNSKKCNPNGSVRPMRFYLRGDSLFIKRETRIKHYRRFRVQQNNSCLQSPEGRYDQLRGPTKNQYKSVLASLDKAFSSLLKAIDTRDLKLYKRLFSNWGRSREAMLHLTVNHSQELWHKLQSMLKGAQSLKLTSYIEVIMSYEKINPRRRKKRTHKLYYIQENNQWKIKRRESFNKK